MEDSYKHRGMRRMLIKEIAKKGITDRNVLKAIGKVPRHFFFDKIFDLHAYEDKAFPIGEGQTISQPYTVAFQTEKLRIKKNEKILEIGTGSGYQACILLELETEVYTIEYNKILFDKTKAFLPKIGYNPYFFCGDGSKGLASHSPFDKIIVTAGSPSIPSVLINQLKIGGTLIIPVGNKDRQKMIKITKFDDKKIKKESYDYFSFVPLLGEKGWYT